MVIGINLIKFSFSFLSIKNNSIPTINISSGKINL